MKKNKNTKENLFEMMSKIDKSFKRPLNEGINEENNYNSEENVNGEEQFNEEIEEGEEQEESEVKSEKASNFESLFRTLIKQYGYEPSQLDDMSDEERRNFFDELDKKWVSDEEEKYLDEARHNPKNYHETLSSAIDDAVKMAESMGYQVDDDEIMNQLGTGGVEYGETKKASISLYKDGKEQRKALQIIVYRMESGKYELTAYIG